MARNPKWGLGQLERDCSVVDRVQRRSSKTEGRRLSSGHYVQGETDIPGPQGEASRSSFDEQTSPVAYNAA